MRKAISRTLLVDLDADIVNAKSVILPADMDIFRISFMPDNQVVEILDVDFFNQHKVMVSSQLFSISLDAAGIPWQPQIWQDPGGTSFMCITYQPLILDCRGTDSYMTDNFFLGYSTAPNVAVLGPIRVNIIFEGYAK